MAKEIKYGAEARNALRTNKLEADYYGKRD